MIDEFVTLDEPAQVNEQSLDAAMDGRIADMTRPVLEQTYRRSYQHLREVLIENAQLKNANETVARELSVMQRKLNEQTMKADRLNSLVLEKSKLISILVQHISGLDND